VQQQFEHVEFAAAGAAVFAAACVLLLLRLPQMLPKTMQFQSCLGDAIIGTGT